MNIFLWLDGDSHRFWTAFSLTYGLVLLAAGAAWLPEGKRWGRVRSPALFGFLMLLAMAGRAQG